MLGILYRSIIVTHAAIFLHLRKFSRKSHQFITNRNIRLYEQCHSQLYRQVPEIERYGNSREQSCIPYENNHSHCLAHA